MITTLIRKFFENLGKRGVKLFIGVFKQYFAVFFFLYKVFFNTNVQFRQFSLREIYAVRSLQNSKLRFRRISFFFFRFLFGIDFFLEFQNQLSSLLLIFFRNLEKLITKPINNFSKTLGKREIKLQNWVFQQFYSFSFLKIFFKTSVKFRQFSREE